MSKERDNEKIKIGIATYFQNYNYGSVLQAYALSTYVDSLGYDSFLMDYLDRRNGFNTFLRIKTYFNRITCGIIHPSVFIETLQTKKVSVETLNRTFEAKRKYEEFVQKYLKVYSDDYRKLDFYIAGSDQVWKSTAPGLHEFYFLRFSKKKGSIAYAASLGEMIIPAYNKRRMKRYLKRFKAISVREEDSKILLENEYGIKVEHVVDPVMLVGKDFWKNRINEKPLVKGDYILCYFLDDCEHCYRLIKEKAKKENLPIIFVQTHSDIYAYTEEKRSTCIVPTPFEFLNLIYHSKYMMTDSFHGTVFALLFEKEFWTFYRQYRMRTGQNNRIESLLNMLQVKERLVINDKMDEKPLDYSNIESIIHEKCQVSQKYLVNALKESRDE